MTGASLHSRALLKADVNSQSSATWPVLAGIAALKGHRGLVQEAKKGAWPQIGKSLEKVAGGLKTRG